MNTLFIKHFFVGFIVSEIPRVSVFGYYISCILYLIMYCIKVTPRYYVFIIILHEL